MYKRSTHEQVLAATTDYCRAGDGSGRIRAGCGRPNCGAIRIDSTGQRRAVRTRPEPDLCGAAAANAALARARIPPRPDIQSSVRERDRTVAEGIQTAS